MRGCSTVQFCPAELRKFGLGYSLAYAAPFAGFGILVIVDHGGGAYSLYGHLAEASHAAGAHLQQQLSRAGLGHVALDGPQGSAPTEDVGIRPSDETLAAIRARCEAAGVAPSAGWRTKFSQRSERMACRSSYL